MATKVTGHTTVLDEDGIPIQNVPINYQMLIPPPSGGVHHYQESQVLSDVSGEVNIPNMKIGAQYAIWGGNFDRMLHVIDVTDYTTPVDDMEYELPGFMYKVTPDEDCNGI